jgi:hypothetical protein
VGILGGGGRGDAWRRLHGRRTVQEVRLLRRGTYAAAVGEEEFVREREERSHRRWRRWGFELAVTGEGKGTERPVPMALLPKFDWAGSAGEGNSEEDFSRFLTLAGRQAG